MTSIKFPKYQKVVTASVNLRDIDAFIDRKSYNVKGYYRLSVKPEIRLYMREHLFEVQKERLYVPGMQVTTRISFTREEFDRMLERMKERKNTIVQIIERTLDQQDSLRKMISESEGLKEFEDYIKETDKGDKKSFVDIIEEFSSIDVTRDESLLAELKKSLDRMPYLFNAIVLFILRELGGYINVYHAQDIEYWKEAKEFLDKIREEGGDEDEYVEKYGEDYPEDQLKHYEELQVTYFGRALEKAIVRAKTEKIKKIYNSESDENAKKRDIAELLQIKREIVERKFGDVSRAEAILSNTKISVAMKEKGLEELLNADKDNVDIMIQDGKISPDVKRDLILDSLAEDIEKKKVQSINDVLSGSETADKKRAEIGKLLRTFREEIGEDKFDKLFLRALIDSYAPISGLSLETLKSQKTMQKSEETEESEQEEGEEQEDFEIEARSIYRNLSDLIDFYKVMGGIKDTLIDEYEKATLLNDYESKGSPKDEKKYKTIYEDKDEMEMSRQMGIPFIPQMALISDNLSDLDGIVYESSGQEFPTPNEIYVLNMIHNMIVKEVEIVDQQVVTDKDRMTGQTSKDVSHDLYIVGFVEPFEYMIQAKPMGKFIEAVPFHDSPDSLPTDDGSIVKYIKHTSAYAMRRRGKIYCVFYRDVNGEKVPFAADENKIYPLNPKAKANYNASIPGQLDALKKFISNSGYSMVEVSRMVDGLIRSSNERKWKANNLIDGRIIDGLASLISGSTRNIEEFERTVRELAQKYSESSNPTLDFYTQEALLYAWDLSKANLNQRESDMSKASIHTIDTYLVVSVRRPDDLFYRKTDTIPYDVMIMGSNIYPRLLLTEMMQTSVTEKEYIVKAGRHVTARYVDRVWMRNFERSPSREVYDAATRSSVVYCSAEEFAVDVITGESLNVMKVIDQLEKISLPDFEYNDYMIPNGLSSANILAYMKDKVANPLIIHYLTQSNTVQPFGPLERRLVKQALEGIAYTLYCKLKAGFCNLHLQDLTAVINMSSPVFRRCPFTRLGTEMVPIESSGNRVSVDKSDKNNRYTIECMVTSVELSQNQAEEGRVLMMPRENDDGVLDVKRVLSAEGQSDLLYRYLSNFFRQAGRTKGFDNGEITDQDTAKHIRKLIDNTPIPDIVMAQVIEHIKYPNTQAVRPLSTRDLEIFINAMKKTEEDFKKNTFVRDSQPIKTFVKTSYGLSARVEDEKLYIEDEVGVGRNEEPQVSIFELPFKKPVTMKEQRTGIVEKRLDEPFVGSMDMTFLTLLDHAMYQGEETFLNGLYTIYHDYPDRGFNHQELGRFLWSELIVKEWPENVQRRIYFLISYQARNRVLQSSERVKLGEGELQNSKPVIIRRQGIRLHHITETTN